jgi:signal transduction histidine kinase
VDLNELTQQVVVAHQAVADLSELDLCFEPCPGIPLVYGEPNQLARLITNLVANALRYTFEGKVIVRTFQVDHSSCLEVIDTGIGIDPEDLPHLFERFYRGRRVRQSDIPGTGLGLAIVKEIVDLHAGEINVESESGKGSRFTVRFPAE